MPIIQGPEDNVWSKLPPEYPFLETKQSAAMQVSPSSPLTVSIAANRTTVAPRSRHRPWLERFRRDTP